MTPTGWHVCIRIARAGIYPLIERVAAEHGIKAGRLFGRSREAHIVAARFRLWTELSERLGMSNRAIAAAFGFDRKAVDRGIDVHLNRCPTLGKPLDNRVGFTAARRGTNNTHTSIRADRPKVAARSTYPHTPHSLSTSLLTSVSRDLASQREPEPATLDGGGVP